MEEDMFAGMKLTAVAALLFGLLGATSCDKDDDDDGPSASQICSAQCAQLEECFPEEFDSTYDSMNECRNECKDDVADALDGVEPACEDEYAGFLLCIAEMSCSELDDYSYSGDLDGCQDEQNDLDDCGGNNQTDYDNVAACQDAEDAINGLDCMSDYPLDLGCDDYAGLPCDYTGYFDCLSGCYSCDATSPVFDTDTYENVCVPLAECN
jgi:hypothetical protein